MTFVVLAAVSALAILAAPLIAAFFASRLEGPDQAQQQEVLTFLLRLFIPQIIFYAIAAIGAGLLNAHKRFGAPMYTPVLNNLAVIAVFAAFYAAYKDADLSLQNIADRQLFWIGGGTTLGVALMAAAQLPWLRGLGRYRLTFSTRHPSLRKLARLSVFVVGYVVTNQIGYLTAQWLANRETGGVTAYAWAFMFFMLPHGLFAVSVMTALLPGMSEFAVNERWNDFRERLSVGIRATFLLILPAAVGFFILSEPIVRLFLEKGVATSESTEIVTGVLRLFVLGLVPFSTFQLMQRAFYALQDTKTPFLINCASVTLNVVVNIAMFKWLGVEGLAAGHALAYTFALTLQARALSKRVGGLDKNRLLASAGRIAVAAAGMGLVVWGVFEATSGVFDETTLLGQTLVVAVPVILGAVVYAGFLFGLRVPELAYVRGVVTRRFGG